MITSRIIATGACVPELVVTNDDLAGIVDTSDEWVTKRTGISRRHISQGENLSDLAAQAAQQALQRAGMDGEQVDMILVATVTPDYGTPSTACQVQKAIGATRAIAFDLTAACSGFLFGLSVADKYIKSGVINNALVIGGEVLSKIVDWTDRGTCVLFGDGAGCALVERSDEAGIQIEEIGTDGSKWEVLTSGYVPAANAFNEVEPLGHTGYISMDGREVFKFATKKIVSSVTSVLEKAGLEADQIRYFVPHQANARIVETAAKKLKVPMEKFYVNIEEYGNTSAASIALALNELQEKGLLERGDRIVLCGFGGGLSWGTILLTW